MTVTITTEPISTLREHAQLSIAFEYDRILELEIVDGGIGGFKLMERELDSPRVKNYDVAESPCSWADRFDISNWGLLVARIDGKRVGGAVIAFDTKGVDMLSARNDFAVLWDIRVDAAYRGKQVGEALFAASEKWCIERGCFELKIETQNINLAACKFYAKQGCKLGAINRFAYPEFPDEVQLLWYKKLV